MASFDTSTFEMIRALRDQIEFKICTSEDFRSLIALNQQLSAYDSGTRDAHPCEKKPPSLGRKPHYLQLVDTDFG